MDLKEVKKLARRREMIFRARRKIDRQIDKLAWEEKGPEAQINALCDQYDELGFALQEIDDQLDSIKSDAPYIGNAL